MKNSVKFWRDIHSGATTIAKEPCVVGDVRMREISVDRCCNCKEPIYAQSQWDNGGYQYCTVCGVSGSYSKRHKPKKTVVSVRERVGEIGVALVNGIEVVRSVG